LVEKLYTAEEIAERLGFTADTILEWARRGELESVRIGRHRRFDEQTVKRFIERHREQNVIPLEPQEPIEIKTVQIPINEARRRSVDS
jgi:excisionase family DNA binding protein